jgi:hypothetical protein
VHYAACQAPEGVEASYLGHLCSIGHRDTFTGVAGPSPPPPPPPCTLMLDTQSHGNCAQPSTPDFISKSVVEGYQQICIRGDKIMVNDTGTAIEIK